MAEACANCYIHPLDFAYICAMDEVYIAYLKSLPPVPRALELYRKNQVILNMRVEAIKESTDKDQVAIMITERDVDNFRFVAIFDKRADSFTHVWLPETPVESMIPIPPSPSTSEQTES